MRTAIILAAGESRRMGTLKPLLPFGSESVIKQVVRSLQACPIDAVLVVVGHRGDEIAAHLSECGMRNGECGLGLARGAPRKSAFPIPHSAIVPNPDYARGMLT